MLKSKRASHIDICIRSSKGVQIYLKNAASKNKNFPYNQIINKMKRKKIILNRKVISEIILKDFTTFKKIINYLEKPLN